MYASKLLMVQQLLVILYLQNGSCKQIQATPSPTQDILAWTKQEVGAMFSFNMITMLPTSNTQYFCIGVGGSGGSLPSADTFNPEMLDMDNWLTAAASFGAKYAVLTAQHCSGFSMWPTDTSSAGFNYTYSIKYSSFKGGSYDLVGDFVSKCKQHGIQPGLYYSLNQNYYLNVGHGKILDTPLVPGQAKVSQELYGKIVLAQLTELWSKYGELMELWFDGGCSVPGISDEISEMLDKLQPNAVYFGGCAHKNNLRWVGTESGLPKYPIWSTAVDCAAGLGDPKGNIFCPAESDTTLQMFDHWFWRKDFPIRSLEELKTVYISTVGRNTNLLLNIAPNSSGLVSNTSLVRYKELGQWINECFSHPIHSTSGSGSQVQLHSSESFTFNIVSICEDQSNGEGVKDFVLYSNNSATVLFSGTAIGNKFIYRLPKAAESNTLTLAIKDTEFTPTITDLSVYMCD